MILERSDTHKESHEFLVRTDKILNAKLFQHSTDVQIFSQNSKTKGCSTILSRLSPITETALM